LIHIKKKYLFQKKTIKLKINSKSPGPIKSIDRRDSESLKANKNDMAFIRTTEGFLLGGFIYNHKGKYTVVPIPDLTLVYFDHAYQMNRVRQQKESDLFKKLTSVDDITEDTINELYHYYGHASNCIISLFTSIESFINHLIPDNKSFEKKLKSKTEIYSKKQIQQHINFSDKLKVVLPFFFDGKNFFKKSTPSNQLLLSLKELRDDIIHTKSEESFELQEKLMNRVLKFNYVKALEATQTFMNFYIPDYIIECDCGKDF
jgi:hypothetical protein